MLASNRDGIATWQHGNTASHQKCKPDVDNLRSCATSCYSLLVSEGSRDEEAL